jgi:plasmid maintenance system antidote protein VapI
MTPNEWIFKGLRESGKHQVELAKALGLDPSQVSRIVSGQRKVQLEEIVEAAKFFGVAEPNFSSLTAPRHRHSHAETLHTAETDNHGNQRDAGMSPLSIAEAAIRFATNTLGIPALTDAQITVLAELALRKLGEPLGVADRRS